MIVLMIIICGSCLSLCDALAIAERRRFSIMRAAFLSVRRSASTATGTVMPRTILAMRLAFFGAMRTDWRVAFMGEEDYFAGAAEAAGAAGAATGAAILPPCVLN